MSLGEKLPSRLEVGLKSLGGDKEFGIGEFWHNFLAEYELDSELFRFLTFLNKLEYSMLSLHGQSSLPSSCFITYRYNNTVH